MPNFKLFKQLRFLAIVFFITDFVLLFIQTYGLSIVSLFIPAILQALVISYMTRYGNYLNEEDYPRIETGEWQDIMDTKGYVYGAYCLLMGALKFLGGLGTLVVVVKAMNNSNLYQTNLDSPFLVLLHAVVLILYGAIVIYYVIMTFILLKNRFPKVEDSQILDKDL